MKMKTVMAALAAFAAFAAGCYNNGEERAAAPEAPAAPEARSVTIQGFAFNPETLVIKKRETVVWTNMDGVRHTVTSAEGDKLDSPLLARGETYSHTFTEAGEFEYICSPHPQMTGTIIVENGAGADNPQKLCPVSGEPIDREHYADVNGYRIYTCCPMCIPAIEADPGKYISEMKEKGIEIEKINGG